MSPPAARIGRVVQMDYDEVVRGRRSIRGYRPDPVPRALIEEILALAMRAPSSYNS
jgi:nitroreductase